MAVDNDKYVGPPYCRAEMYVGRVACFPMVSHAQWVCLGDRQTDGRQTVTLSFPLCTRLA